MEQDQNKMTNESNKKESVKKAEEMIKNDANVFYEKAKDIKFGSNKVKLYRLKIGSLLLVFKRKLKEGEVIVTHTRAQLLAADLYQAQFFGYKPLRVRAWFMSKSAIMKHLEKKYSEQGDIPKTRFTNLMKRQQGHRERILKTRVMK